MRPSSIVIAGMLLGLGRTAAAWADDPATDSLRCEAARADAGPPPPFVSARRPLDSDDLALKKEGVYPTGIPLFGSDPDTGWGFGVQGFLFWDGPCADPLFPYAPYQHKLSLQLWATTNGYQEHELQYDAPYLLGTPYRLRADAYYERNTAENYFGRGAATMGNLSFPFAGGQTFSTFDGYTDALDRVRPNGLADVLYNKYDLQDPTLHATVERSFGGGLARIQAGFAVQYDIVHDYSGAQVQGVNGATGAAERATTGQTRLAADCAAGRIVGCAGGWNNTLKAGASYDSRDFEPDPNRGIFTELTAEASTRAFGSDFTYARVTTSWRGFYSPFPRLADLVLAGRFLFQAQTSGTPFFSMNTLALTDGDQQGLGGVVTLRGYHQDRFVGPLATLANGELRWTFVTFDVAGEGFGLQLVPFVEAGRVYDAFSQLTPAGWRNDGGVGLHVLWDKSTVIVFDYGISTEDEALYINFNEEF